MAFELVHSGTYTVNPGEWALEDLSEVRPHMAALNLIYLVGAVLRVRWNLEFDDGPADVWRSEDITVATGDGIITPIVPVARRGLLYVDVVSGGPAALSWDLFGL
jgi:hypothetical protein